MYDHFFHVGIHRYISFKIMKKIQKLNIVSNAHFNLHTPSCIQDPWFLNDVNIKSIQYLWPIPTTDMFFMLHWSLLTNKICQFLQVTNHKQEHRAKLLMFRAISSGARLRALCNLVARNRKLKRWRQYGKLYDCYYEPTQY